MSMITAPTTQVNPPAFTTTTNINTGRKRHFVAEPYASHLLECIMNTGLHDAPEIEVPVDSIGNDGLTILIGGQPVRIQFVPVPMETWADTHEVDDTIPPEAEDAMYASWADGQLRDLDDAQLRSLEFGCWVELQDRSGRGDREEATSTDAEIERWIDAPENAEIVATVRDLGRTHRELLEAKARDNARSLERSAPMTDDEMDEFFSDSGPGSVPTARYATTGCSPRVIRYAADAL